MNYSQAASIIAAKKRQAVTAADERFLAAMNAHPELREAEKSLRRAIMSGDKTAVAACEKAKSAALAELGFAPDAFAAPVACKVCGDSGYADGKYCACTKRLAASDTAGECPPPYTFETADMTVFSDSFTKRAYDAMRAYSAKFPNTNTTNILIVGYAGTGKSYLAACVANEVLSKGFGAMFISAFRFNDLCLKYHTSFGSDKSDYLNALLDTDLLVIDDLGSESILRNVTLEYLFTVVDERMRSGKHTLITSNLLKEKLGTRYGERTVSRLFSERVCMPITLDGEDLRKKK